jgi:3-hydroxymyristoyl/3-hydroxydecanoyl-(acyl carrier protein) dehydratase
MIALHELLSCNRPGHTSVCRDGAARGTIDFASFRAQVFAIAARLSGQHAHRYALFIHDPFDFACALFALLACRKEPILPASLTPGYLADLVDAYDAVLTDVDVRAYPGEQSVGALPLTIEPDAQLTIYTSGSTGAPKPVLKTLSQMNAEVHTLESEWGQIVGDATILASVPHHHIYGLLFRLLWPLAAGRAFDRAVCTEPRDIQPRIQQYGSAVVVSSPAQLSRWPALPGFAVLKPEPRAFFSSGGPLAEKAATEYAEVFGSAPIEIYGSTETGGIAWRRQNETSAWRPLTGIEVQRNEEGALEVRSPHLSHDGWHRTDDAIRFDDDRCFRLQGRLDRVIKVEGKRVSMPEIESRLALHPYVAHASVVPLASASRERVGVVVVLSDAGGEALRREGRIPFTKSLRRHLAEYFDAVVLPRYWRFRSALPLDANGKLPIAAVKAAFKPRPDGAEVLSETRSGDDLYYELRVPKTLRHFEGHFPGLPILPGVVQVDWAIRLAADHVTGVRAVESVDRLKFTAPVPPGAVLGLKLSHDAARRRMQFTYGFHDRDCSSGVIVYRDRA